MAVYALLTVTDYSPGCHNHADTGCLSFPFVRRLPDNGDRDTMPNGTNKRASLRKLISRAWPCGLGVLVLLVPLRLATKVYLARETLVIVLVLSISAAIITVMAVVFVLSQEVVRQLSVWSKLAVAQIAKLIFQLRPPHDDQIAADTELVEVAVTKHPA
jgi:hypothetical protein